MCDYWYDDDEDTLKDILTAIENVTRIMATEGTLFIFEWQYTMYLSIHPTADQQLEETINTVNLDVHEQLGITNKELEAGIGKAFRFPFSVFRGKISERKIE